jgi:hypothetical protein
VRVNDERAQLRIVIVCFHCGSQVNSMCFSPGHGRENDALCLVHVVTGMGRYVERLHVWRSAGLRVLKLARTRP